MTRSEIILNNKKLKKEGLKYCNRCKTIRKLELFFKSPPCKICYQEIKKEYHLQNKEKFCEKTRKWYKNNKEKALKYKRNYYFENRIAIGQKNKQYKKEHKDFYREYAKNYMKERAKIDINFKLICTLRRRFSNALKRNQKGGSAIADLGCSIEFLKLS